MITKDMTIGEIRKLNASKQGIWGNLGMLCVGCASAQAETVEEAAYVHGINLEELLEALNK